MRKGVHCHDRSHLLAEPDKVSMDIEPTTEEIKRYVENDLLAEISLGDRQGWGHSYHESERTTSLGRLCRRKRSLETRIPEVISASANGMFMMARLYMDALKVKRSVEEVNDTLNNLPKGYDAIYDRTMARIDSSSLNDANNSDSRRQGRC